MKSISVVTYNLHKGMSPLGRRALMPEIAGALQGLDPDVLFLQEVQGRHLEREQQHQGWPQHDFLAGQLTRHASYGMNARYDHGHHGNAVLSRFPIAAAANHDLTVNRLEQRGLLHTLIQPQGWAQPVACLCGHFNLLARDRRRQYQVLLRYIRQHIPADMPLILAGDFNDWQREADELLKAATGLAEAFVSHTGRHARSFPARLPLLPLDRIYLRGLEVESVVVCRGQPWSHLSDHLPLLARVRPRGRH
ncbi:endonuclease/exonuclease/phosphatase family protein [Vogesella sp. LIG4]|uniref:endonuclease/exonuclease/phosphatase family protein n=1 Tax=Vogesella sp. LIG4 TaxID=1192162 RepID=UPI00081FFAB2|nr:endonuclease/exonuclease/phosphatase family protein [Vogesella sp. LIG4]SCK22811.1 Metal-dependent hydrolase, endonuclease/exonuclease/phosphatase family [Vogesella sp. LIG4]